MLSVTFARVVAPLLMIDLQAVIEDWAALAAATGAEM